MEKGKVYELHVVGPLNRSWQIRIPRFAIFILFGISVLGLATVTVLANSYARMLLKVSNYNHLRAEREDLSAKCHLLEKVVKGTNTELSSLEGLASEVAVSYRLGKIGRTQFPQRPLIRTPRDGNDPESSYDASLYAFNLVKDASLETSRNSLLLGLLSNPEMEPAHIPSIWPVYGEISSGFGERLDPFSEEAGFHPGIDIAAPYGSPVRATAAGSVLEAGPGMAGYGNIVVIDHGSGIETIYCHLSKVEAAEGQQVQQGQVIGAVGMSGRSTGPHLHYEVLIHQTPVNPEKFLRG
jgi:murein DD-endopeptidase MepM/ murein hydrolase activator NlpD